MTRNEYLNTLDRALGNMSPEEKQEILYDYEEHFSIGLANGQTEEEICMELGDPRFVAKQYRAGSFVKQAEEKRTGRNIARAVFAAVSLGFFNLIFIIPIFFALVGILIGLYGAGIGLALSGIGIFFGTLLQPVLFDLISLPDINPGILIFGSIALTSFGALFCIFDAYVTKFFYLATIRYIKANIGLINK